LRCCSRRWPPTRSSDRRPAVDREQARRNIRTGLWLGLMAAGLFALTFVVATIYIASP